MRFSQVITLCLLSIASYAQIDTDRPAFTNSVNVVPKSTLQFEGGMGYTVQRNSVVPIINIGRSLKRLETFTLPQVVYRCGISNGAEVRLEMPQLSLSRYQFFNDSQSTFTADLWNRRIGVGLKLQVINNQKFRLSNLVTLRSNRDYSILSEREVTFDLSSDLLWDYRISEKSKAAGVVGFAKGRDAYFVNAAVLYGRTFGENLWIQSEIVLQTTHSKDSRFNWQSNTLNLSGQYALTKQDAIDLTLGSIFRSTFVFTSPNLSVQLGYAHLFNSNK